MGQSREGPCTNFNPGPQHWVHHYLFTYLLPFFKMQITRREHQIPNETLHTDKHLKRENGLRKI